MTVRRVADSTLNELSAAIGELRNSASAQITTNQNMLDELRKINERLSSIAQLDATFQTYRGTLHERFNKIHDQIVDLDAHDEKMEDRMRRCEQAIGNWKSNLGMLYYVFIPAMTVASSFLSAYAREILRALL